MAAFLLIVKIVQIFVNKVRAKSRAGRYTSVTCQVCAKVFRFRQLSPAYQFHWWKGGVPRVVLSDVCDLELPHESHRTLNRELEPCKPCPLAKTKGD